MVLPTGTAMPVPPEVLTVMICAVLLSTMYSFVLVGQVTVPAPVNAVPVSVNSRIAQRDSEVVPSAVVKVCALAVHESIVALPAIACSTISVILSFTTSPQVPLNSPWTGRASLRIVVYCVVMFLPSCGYVLPVWILSCIYINPIWILCIINILPVWILSCIYISPIWVLCIINILPVRILTGDYLTPYVYSPYFACGFHTCNGYNNTNPYSYITNSACGLYSCNWHSNNQVYCYCTKSRSSLNTS